jgi:hypothetical protein
MTVNLRVVDSQSPSGFRELVSSERGDINLNGGFTEREAANFFFPAGFEHELFVDDELLSGSKVQGHEGWVWTPRFYAGTVRAELMAKGETTGQTYLLDVAPDSRKIGQTEFRRLIQDILDVDPTLLVGNEPARHGSAGSGPTDNADMQYAYLFQYGEGLLTALRAVEARPRRSLRSSRITVPLSRVRRVDAHTAISMARNGSLAAFRAAEGGRGATRDCQDLRFDVPFSIESLDSAATRCIAALTRAVLRRAVQVSLVLERQAAADTDSDTRTGFRSRWPRRRAFLDSLVEGLRGALSREPLRSARREEITAAGLTAVAADPMYARVQRLAWKVLRPGAPASVADSWAWMSPTWNLYETWCFIRLALVLRRLLPLLTWGSIAVAGKDNAAGVEGIGPDVRIRLLSQLTFTHPRHGSKRGEFWSISKELRPDLVVTVERPGMRRWFVLDAKYSQARSTVLEAMHSAHVYHDALRWFEAPPYRSLLLVPASGEDIHWLHEQTFKADHGVGVATCSPADENQNAIVTEIKEIVEPEAS